jgi:programmed cell death protein 5
MEEQRLFILDQLLEPAAKDRLKRLNLVKADKARSIEDALINAAKNGQLKSKVSMSPFEFFLFLHKFFLK